MNHPTPAYTAAQLARALGRKRQAIGRALRTVMADGSATVNGIAARAWSYSALPVHLQRQLDAAADARGCRNVEHLLSLPDEAASEIVPTPAPLKPKAQTVSIANESTFRPLTDYVALFKDSAVPTAREKAALWLRAFDLYSGLIADGHAPKKLKRALLNFLSLRAGFLVSDFAGDRRNALRVNFDRKYQAWLQADGAPGALVDRRSDKSGNFRAPTLTTEDRDNLIRRAVFDCGGRVAQAWRELIERRELSEPIVSYYLHNPSRKSHVPAAIMDSVKYEVAMMEDIHHGPRQDRLNGAHISRDWSTVFAGDWYQGDDGTLPVYYSVPDGQGWYNLMRGQTLLMIDLRSTRILGFVLISERNYNSRAIRTLTTKVCDRYGLPRKGFYFENGIWRARILKGSEQEPISLPETEMGLREFGLRFIHARLPRAKPVEGVFGAVQNLMEGLPGYVGRNEQTEKFERVQKAKRDVESRRVKPDGLFLTEEQWTDALERICAQYNAAPQNGKMTGGLSPDAAHAQYQNHADPAVKFSPECRYLLANHRRPVKVTNNGITLPGTPPFNYRNAETGKLRGQTVLAWFDPECPEILTVTDMNRKNAFSIERSQDVPAMDASAEIMGQELGRIAEHQAYAKARYRVLQPRHAIKVRPMIADADTVELGVEIGAQRVVVQTTIREQNSREARFKNVSREIPLPRNHGQPLRPETVSAAERLARTLEDDPAEAAETKGQNQ